MADDFLTNFSWIGPGYGLVWGQCREQCVWKLRHQNIHVKQGVHLHRSRCFIVFTRHTACSSLFILIKGDTEHVWRHFPKQRKLLLWPLWVFKMQPPSQLMTHEHAALSTATWKSTKLTQTVCLHTHALALIAFIHIFCSVSKLEAWLGARLSAKKSINKCIINVKVTGLISLVSTTGWKDVYTNIHVDINSTLGGRAQCYVP